MKSVSLYLKYAPLVIVSLLLSLLVINISSNRTDALSGSDFNPGRIIDDAVFYNSNSMTASQIQLFLNSKLPTCDTNGTQMYNSTQTRAQWAVANGKPIPPYTCLKDYSQAVPTVTNSGSDLCKNSIAGGTKSAAQIILDAAQACGINPQVLIVMLQKEQSLITDNWPWPIQYNTAMGYACPDSGPNNSANCDASFFGFFNQVYNAAKAYRRYEANPTGYNYRANRNNFVLFNPNTSCGGTDIFIQNQATASLYIYTPYQPNAAALNNLYGTGNGCSAYGNRNFWRMFNDWFGSTFSDDTLNSHPSGTLVSGLNKVFLIDNGQKKHIVSPNIFNSYNYKWDSVKKATIGDLGLPDGFPIDSLAPGTIFRTDNSPVYIMNIHEGMLKKQHISYSAFVALGYMWDEILYINSNEVTGLTIPGILDKPLHPTGTIIVNPIEGKVYKIDNATRRHVLGPVAFNSNNLRWDRVKQTTSADNELPLGAPLDVAPGTILHANGIFVVEYDSIGILRRPFGPWECYFSKMNYSPSDWTYVLISSLPSRTGPLFTC